MKLLLLFHLRKPISDDLNSVQLMPLRGITQMWFWKIDFKIA